MMADDDLKCEILDLKRRLRAISSERVMFKVKIQKLQNEVNQKDKQIDSLLDPQKSTCVRKIISERGASMIIKLKHRNNDLEEKIMTQDAQIKKLQLELQTSKVYLSREISPTSIRYEESKLSHIPLKCSNYRNFESFNTKNKCRSRSLSNTPTRPACLKSCSEVQLEYARLSENLQKIKLANNDAKSYTSLSPHSHKNYVNNHIKDDNYDYPKSIVSVASDKCNKHNSQDLEIYLINITNEMETIKETMSQLSIEQENTNKLLKDKNRTIDLLAKQVKKLQKTRCRSPVKSISHNCARFKAEANISKAPINDETSTNNYSQENFEDALSENSFKMKEDLSEEIQCSLGNSDGNTSDEIKTETSLSDDDDVETGN